MLAYGTSVTIDGNLFKLVQGTISEIVSALKRAEMASKNVKGEVKIVPLYFSHSKCWLDHNSRFPWKARSPGYELQQ